MRRERALHLYNQLMGRGGAVNRLLVDTIEEGIVQKFWLRRSGDYEQEQEQEHEHEYETRQSRLA